MTRSEMKAQYRLFEGKSKVTITGFGSKGKKLVWWGKLGEKAGPRGTSRLIGKVPDSWWWLPKSFPGVIELLNTLAEGEYSPTIQVDLQCVGDKMTIISATDGETILVYPV